MSFSQTSPGSEASGDLRVLVSGVGLISPAGVGVKRTWAAAQAQHFTQGPLPAPLDLLLPDERCARIQPELESDLPMPPRARRFLSAAGRHFAVCAQEALRESRLTTTQLHGFGISVGSTNGERNCREALQPFLGAPRDGGDDANSPRRRSGGVRGPVHALRAQPGLIAGNLAIACGARGPVFTFINDGLAAGIALGEALRAIARGDCPGMLAGGCGEVDDPWLLLDRREARDLDAPARAWASSAACLVLESASSIEARGAAPLAELRGYWQGEAASTRRAAARACRGLELAAVIAEDTRALQAAGLIPGPRHWDGRAIHLPADCLGATQALQAALAIHALGGHPARSPRAARQAALCIDCDPSGACTALLIAEAATPRPH